MCDICFVLLQYLSYEVCPSALEELRVNDFVFKL